MRDGGAGYSPAMQIDFSGLPARTAYQWIASSVMPRPIAWVSTVSPEGAENLAPFSFFQGITGNPPTLMFVGANTRDGLKKDTILNIERVPEFVVNLVPYALASVMNDTASNLPHGESEAERFGVEMTASAKVRPRRIAASPVSFECSLDRIVNVGTGPLAANVVFGRILMVHARDDVLADDGFPDPAKLDLVGRLGREDYTRTRDTFSIKRPDR